MREIKYNGYQLQQSDKYALAVMHVLHGGKWKTRQLLGYDPDAQTKWVQYIGIKDKNGVKIYEGDIVTNPRRASFDEDDREPRVVKCQSTGSAWFDPFGTGDFSWSSYDCDVIGNIYENPELLEKAS